MNIFKPLKSFVGWENAFAPCLLDVKITTPNSMLVDSEVTKEIPPFSEEDQKFSMHIEKDRNGSTADNCGVDALHWLKSASQAVARTAFEKEKTRKSIRDEKENCSGGG